MPLPIYVIGDYKGSIPADKSQEMLYLSSRHIDSLTFNRIINRGYENLTCFQKEILSKVCMAQAEFEYENSDVINSILSSYSINGVSMNLGGDSWNMIKLNGVIMQRSNYELLKQTGLCCRSLGVF